MLIKTTKTNGDIVDHNIDVTSPEHIEVLIRDDGKVVWVNVNGVCMFRACRIENLTINDERKG